MSKSIQLRKQSTEALPDISSYKLTVETLNAQNMPDKIFVNQRIRNFAKDTIEDIFVAVCTPAQIEDFDADSPATGTGFFRTNRIELVARTPEMLQDVFDSIVFEVKKLVVDLTDMDRLSNAEIYEITASDPVVILE